MFSTIFAIMSVYLDHIIANEPPRAIDVLGVSPIKIHLGVLSILGGIITFRLINLHCGMVLNGTFWAAAIAGDSSESSLKAASDFNYLGVSTVHIVLTSVVTSISLGCWFGIQVNSDYSAVLMALAVLVTIGIYFRIFRHTAVCRLAKASLKNQEHFPTRVDGDERTHARATLDMTHHDMIAITSSVGLLVFSLLQTMWVLQSDSEAIVSDAPYQRHFGVLLYGIAVLVAAVSGTVAYCRLGRSIVTWSQSLDCGDRAADRLFTDSFLGYMILLIFLAFACHTVAYTFFADIIKWQSDAIPGILWALVFGTFATGVAMYLWFLAEKADALDAE